MTVYYLSGPISSPDPAVMRANKEAFMDADEAMCLRFPGCTIVNPVVLCADIEASGLVGRELWIACMRECLRELPRCDEIVLLPGFSGSAGATVELYNAEALRMPVHMLAGLLACRNNLQG